jgi:hypothetical protein
MRTADVLGALALPDLPTHLKVGDELPIARYVSDRVGAVLWIMRNEPPLEEHSVYQQYIDVVVQADDGSWSTQVGNAGSDWADAICQRPAGAELWTSGLISAYNVGGKPQYQFASGIAGDRVVRIVNREGDTLVEIGGPSAPWGAFILPLRDGTVADIRPIS